MIYELLKRIVQLSLFFFFRKIELSGKENLKENGPVILVANHPNTLMDPLLVASLTKKRIGFVANASIFINRVVTAIFSYFHVIPIYRQEDTVNGDKPDNFQSFAKCHDYLESNGNLLIFPEGTSHYELKLRKIKTGTARIALSYESLKNFSGNLKIIPIALDYSDAIQFRSVVSVTICAPIEIKNYKANYLVDEFRTVQELTEDIRKAFAEIVPQTSGKAEENLLVKAHHFYLIFRSQSPSLVKDPRQALALRSQVSKAIRFLRKQNKELYASIQEELNSFFKILKEEGIRPNELLNEDHKNGNVLVMMSNLIVIILVFPFYLLGLIFNYIPYIIPAKLFKASKLDIEYKASVQMLIGLIIFPLYYGFLLMLFRAYVTTNFWQIFLFLLSLPLLGFVTMFYYATYKRLKRELYFKYFMPKSKKEVLLSLKKSILNHMEIARNLVQAV